MTNDTTTLNGALMELGETMASNLTSKGVSASANDGLTTLAGKILKIPNEYLIYGTDINLHSPNNTSKTLTSTECILSNSNTSSTRYMAILPDCFTATTVAETRCFSANNYCLEMDFVDYNIGAIQIYSTSSVSVSFDGFFDTTDENFHLKLTLIDNIARYYIDGELFNTSNTLNLTNGLAFRFSIPSSTSLKFKNLKLYTI